MCEAAEHKGLPANVPRADVMEWFSHRVHTDDAADWQVWNPDPANMIEGKNIGAMPKEWERKFARVREFVKEK